jgi:hypothetical protein
MLTLLAIFFGLAGQGHSRLTTISLTVITGIDRISFDSEQISEKDLRRWINLSPIVSTSNGYLVPESLQLCVAARPEYKDCGTRDWTAPNFIYNANVNLEKIRVRISDLDEKSYPQELQSVVSYLNAIQQNDLHFEGQLLKFVEDGRSEYLTEPFRGIDPAAQCATEITKIRAAQDQDTAYRLASRDWFRCVNAIFRRNIGNYPESIWKKFLRQRSIREELVDQDGE